MQNVDRINLDAIIEKISKVERISIEEGVVLYHEAPLLTLAQLADQRRYQLHPEKIITFVVDRNINYTNICMSGCKFCAFYKIPEIKTPKTKTSEIRTPEIKIPEIKIPEIKIPEIKIPETKIPETKIPETKIPETKIPETKTSESKDGYVISKESLHEKIEETIALGGTQILLQGGMNPALSFDYYIDILQYIKKNFDIHIHGFSPPEISWLANVSSLTIKDTIIALKEAGLGSIPGGGAEILCDEIRQKISPNKCMSAQWLEVMEKAHELGLRSSATMMFGHIESPVHIFEHLDKIRELQDRTGGFTAFIPWTFQPDNTSLGILNSQIASSDINFNNTQFSSSDINFNNRKLKIRKASAVEYLRVLALSRIFLDNFDNIQASWVTQGDKIAQTALFYGANDMGSTMIEENVVASAGVDFMLPEKELRRLIEQAGFVPRQRDCFYNLL
ncbi:MAG: radical SAM protein [Desulfamplus sp.]|nr:radical SAM protein [Desulfamplus sp.]